jgi:hypothetical protein
MGNLHTITLHEAKHPERPFTFTLDGEVFSMDISALLALEAAGPEAPPKEPWEERLEQAALKLVQPFCAPAHVRDIRFQVEDNKLTLQIWKRARGLRLAPMVLVTDEVDDPQAAAEFAALLRERAQTAAQPGKYQGAFDYWATWAALVLGAASFGAAAAYFLTRGRKHRHD